MTLWEVRLTFWINTLGISSGLSQLVDMFCLFNFYLIRKSFEIHCLFCKRDDAKMSAEGTLHNIHMLVFLIYLALW